MLFTQALLLEAPGRPGEVWAGAAAGLLAVLTLATLTNRTVVRLPLGPFFAVSSTLMCVLAISFAGAGIYELVAAGYLAKNGHEVTDLGTHTTAPVDYPDISEAVAQAARLNGSPIAVPEPATTAFPKGK